MLQRPGKNRRQPGNPVADPKPYPKFIPPPATNLVNLSLDLDLILPDEAKAAQDTDLLIFHSVGDTGGIHGDDVERAISNAMEQQISESEDKNQAPAF
jgi:hypothetical protein